MKYYFAPMEGVTGYIFRRIHREHFPGTDKYYTPFIVANQTLHMKTREKKDIAPENNACMPLAPQVLANKADECMAFLRILAGLGYREVNLNLGCPAATVFSKKRGSGMLTDPEMMDRFLEGVFGTADAEGLPLRISVKTRLGVRSEEEWPGILEVFRKYPIAELTVHARVREDFYGKEARTDAYLLAEERTDLPLCYNGDIRTPEDYKRISAKFRRTGAVMMGRGFVENPALHRELSGGEPLSRGELADFSGDLYRAYRAADPSPENTIYKMKELWTYWGRNFPEEERAVRNVKKARSAAEYEAAARAVFQRF